MRLKTLLTSIYEPFGNHWVKSNGIVFDAARQAGLTLAGSIALSVGRKKTVRLPGDIDFVCETVSQARDFIKRLEDFLLKKSVYWKVQINSKTAFCPDGCTVHFRFTAPFWLPICIMVIPKVSYWRVTGGDQIQNFDDVVKAAKALDERDGKGRLDEEPKSDQEPPEIPWEEPRDTIRIPLEFEKSDIQEHTYPAPR